MPLLQLIKEAFARQPPKLEVRSVELLIYGAYKSIYPEHMHSGSGIGDGPDLQPSAPRRGRGLHRFQDPSGKIPCHSN
jgi:hypothetical protein